ncbi:MAG: hypothetical protein FWC58_09275 [Desulfobulbus sp.]|nr:hypothetical protein [Desulfobulbus sp.]
MAGYARGTLAQQTGQAASPRMHFMPYPNGLAKKETAKMIEMNIKGFLATARLYLLGLLPQQPQPTLAVIPLRRKCGCR